MSVLRNCFGFLIGLAVFVICVYLFEFAFSRVAPPPPGMDPRDPSMMQMLPAIALWLVLFGWAAASVIGGFVSARISKNRWIPIALGLLATLVGITNNREFPPPEWFWVLTLFSFLPFFGLGSKLARIGGQR